jgi:hypothetical protein
LNFTQKVFVFAALVAVVAAGGYHRAPAYKQEKPYVSHPAPSYHHTPTYKENKPAYQPEYKSAEYAPKSYDVRQRVSHAIFYVLIFINYF